MTLRDLNVMTGLDEDELQAYCADGLIGKDGEFNEQDVRNIGSIRTLLKFGLTNTQIKAYFTSLQQSDYEQAVRILRDFRKKLLHNIHSKQENLDILDCMIRDNENKKETK